MTMNSQVSEILRSAVLSLLRNETGRQGPVTPLAWDVVDTILCKKHVSHKETRAAGTCRYSSGENGAMFVTVAREKMSMELSEGASIHDYRDFGHPARNHSRTLFSLSNAVSVAAFQRFDLLESCSAERPRQSVGPETPSA